MTSPLTSRAGAEDSVSSSRTSMVCTILALIIFVVSRAYILFAVTPLLTDVPASYFNHVTQVIDSLRVPYQKAPEGVEIEYPPLAWWVTCLPRLLDNQALTEPQNPQQVRPIRAAYHTTYRRMMFLCDLCCFPLLLAIVWKRRRNWVGWVALAYTIVTASSAHLLYDRLDLPLLLLLLLWAYCWVSSLDASRQRAGWAAAAYGFLGLSISLKLIPVVAAPFLLLADFYGPRRVSRLAVGLMFLILGAALPFFLQFLESGPAVFSVFGHHAERGIQIESIYANVILLAWLFGTPISILNTHGAFEVACQWSPAMKTLSTILLPAFLGGMGLWALLRWSRWRREDAYCTACFVIAAVVILSNVFSPQYLIWSVPMMLLLAVERLPNRPAIAWVLFGCIMLMVAMTTWLFPYNYFRSIINVSSGSMYGLVPDGATFRAPSAVAIIVLALRNALYLGIVVWLGTLLIRRSDNESTGISPSGEVNIQLSPDRPSGRKQKKMRR